MLWDLIQKYVDSSAYSPSERQLARRLGVAPNTLKLWKDPKALPSRENLQAIAELIGVRYSTVLDAALRDTGYHEESVVTPLHGRPVATIEAELRVARADLDEWNGLRVKGEVADRKREAFQARVDTLSAELAVSRKAGGESRSVTKM